MTKLWAAIIDSERIELVRMRGAVLQGAVLTALNEASRSRASVSHQQAVSVYEQGNVPLNPYENLNRT